MKDFKKILLPGIATILFFVGAGFLLWRESAQVHLKSGIKLYEENRPEAADVLESGLKKNRHHYLLHLYEAKVLQKRAFQKMAAKIDATDEIVESNRHLMKGLALRSDSSNYFQLAQNFKLQGKFIPATINYNIAFFYSQDSSRLGDWKDMRQYQQKAAKVFFGNGNVGASFMAVYNHLSGFSSFNKNSSPQTKLFRDYFLSISPDKWLTTDSEGAKMRLKVIFDIRSPEEQNQILAALNESGFRFLPHFFK